MNAKTSQSGLAASDLDICIDQLSCRPPLGAGNPDASGYLDIAQRFCPYIRPAMEAKTLFQSRYSLADLRALSHNAIAAEGLCGTVCPPASKTDTRREGNPAVQVISPTMAALITNEARVLSEEVEQAMAQDWAVNIDGIYVGVAVASTQDAPALLGASTLERRRVGRVPSRRGALPQGSGHSAGIG
jgi:hypothetical protein